MHNDLKFNTRIKFVGNSVVCYKSAVDNIGRRVNNGENLKEDRKKAYKGEITGINAKQARELLWSWFYTLDVGNERMHWKGTYKEVKLVFVTLTLSAAQVHTDKEIKANMLELFLKYLKYHYKVVNYFWKAESQQNGNIHFHIIIDKFVDKKVLQAEWNRIQNKYGYIGRFYDVHKHVNPPSTHVRIFETTDKALEYQLKYMTKNNEYRKIEGLQFRASNKLSKLKPYSVDIYPCDENRIYNLLENNAIKVYKSDFATVFYYDNSSFEMFKYLVNDKNLFDYYDLLFRTLYTIESKPFYFDLIYKLFHNIVNFRIDLLDYVKKNRIDNEFGCLLDDFKRF